MKNNERFLTMKTNNNLVTRKLEFNINDFDEHAYAPYSSTMLVQQCHIGKLVLDYYSDGKLKGYHFENVLIKNLVDDPLYAEFQLNSMTSAKEVFNYVYKAYVEAEKAPAGVDYILLNRAKGLFQRASAAVQDYNNAIIQELNSEIKYNKAEVAARIRRKDLQEEHTARWNQLVDSLGETPDFDSLSDHQRAILLDRARDLGLEVPQESFDSKDHYTMRVAGIASEPDDIQDYAVYHKVTDADPIVSFVGRYHSTEQLRAAENEIMVMALWLTKNTGDEFLTTRTLPGGVVTDRDIRLGYADPEEFYVEYRDFQYEGFENNVYANKDNLVKDDMVLESRSFTVTDLAQELEYKQMCVLSITQHKDCVHVKYKTEDDTVRDYWSNTVPTKIKVHTNKVAYVSEVVPQTIVPKDLDYIRHACKESPSDYSSLVKNLYEHVHIYPSTKTTRPFVKHVEYNGKVYDMYYDKHYSLTKVELVGYVTQDVSIQQLKETAAKVEKILKQKHTSNIFENELNKHKR